MRWGIFAKGGNEQIGREASTRIGIETERAKQRQLARQNNHAAQADAAWVPEQKEDRGRARDKAGEKVGVSGKTAVVLVPGLAASVPGSLLGFALRVLLYFYSPLLELLPHEVFKGAAGC